ncbi:hypothetical protein KDL44_04250 [bacterium]|nr:hypothetical protein [bacterium]
MSREKIKILEMVQEGRLTPEEGLKLINALQDSESRESGRGGSSGAAGNRFDVPNIKLPKINLENLGEVAVEFQNSLVDTFRRTQRQYKRSKAARYTELKDFPVKVEVPDGIKRCNLTLDIRAGRVKVKGGDSGSPLIQGKVKNTPTEPVIISDVKGGKADVTLKHSIGRSGLKLNPDIAYVASLHNAAADAHFDLSSLDVKDLEIDNQAGNMVLQLGRREDRVEMDVRNNAGSITLHIPEDYALRLEATGSLSKLNLEKYGMELHDGVAESSDWDDNPRGVSIHLSQNVAAFLIEWKRRDGIDLRANGHRSEAEADLGVPVPDADDDDFEDEDEILADDDI